MEKEKRGKVVVQVKKEKGEIPMVQPPREVWKKTPKTHNHGKWGGGLGGVGFQKGIWGGKGTR